MVQTLIEKIVQKFAVDLEPGQILQSGDYVTIRPAHILTHDNTSAIMKKFKQMGCSAIKDDRQAVFALDHNIQDQSSQTRNKYAAIEAFAKKNGVDFYPAGRGIGHQIMCEEGYAWPGDLVVASDSHANMYGGLGALGTPVVRTDAAAVWATGKIWWQVPPVVRVYLHGRLRPGVSGKDVIIALTGLFNHDEVLNHAVEFAGDGLQDLSLEQRLTIANMTTEWGARAGVFPVDAITYSWLESRAVSMEGTGAETHTRMNIDRIAVLKHEAPFADPDAVYAKELELDLETITPLVAGPDHVKTIHSAGLLGKKDISIQKAYLLSCVNSRVEDLAEAAGVLKGQRVAGGVDFYVAAASSEVEAESKRRGDWQILVEAGAKVLPSGCGPCIGLGVGLVEDGEVGISATNRNFKGRMGSKDAQVYLASPAVVAASAVAGKLVSHLAYEDQIPKGRVKLIQKTTGIPAEVELLPGFPSEVSGSTLFCHQDNLNTDGIFPGSYTYRDDLTPEEEAEVVMQNYDESFRDLVRKGTLLVGGFNFGTGSSREQAATAFKHAGVSLLIAGSFNETYKRNALNNGFIILESPEFVNYLVESHGRHKLTVDTGIGTTVNFEHTSIHHNDQTFTFQPLGKAAQELILAGGLENWVKERL
ncbi:MAG: homoaconitase [Candidatus Marinimicrobia bacterium]|nr:homoaconitase [Candidatus Neomarinimicrobiota bacterium]MCF7904001.1 homoaconitase [Candidatus Neomarinimicrobiota bacterium]